MSDELLYEYAIIRYVPDVEREEFVNVGLIMMCKRLRWLRVGQAVNPDRLAAYDCPHSADEIQNQLRTFTLVGDGDAAGGPMASLPAEERFRWLTAVKSACLQTSRPHPGKTTDLDATFDRLFDRLVR